MSVNVIVNFNVKNNKLTEFITILKMVKMDLPKVKGCLGVDIYRDAVNNNMFTLMEVWETKALHKAYISQLIDDGSWAFIITHLSKEAESGYYKKL